jgi:diadenosine tetraphosphate (Ap4A) HIT family hydrolase
MTTGARLLGCVLACCSWEVMAQCTPVPRLLDRWNQAIVAEISTASGQPSAQEIQDRIQIHRARSAGLPNPFVEIARMDAVERSDRRERVLWEDGEIMVLVNKPRGSDLYALVIPKARNVWFVVDASPRLMERLEQTAATVSDSFLSAVGKPCRPGDAATIEIHTPEGLGIQQLHVHVRISPPAGGDLESLYTKASEYLSKSLWSSARY